MRKFCSEINADLIGKEAEVFAWLFEMRSFGALKFIILKDRTGECQLTLHKSTVSAEMLSAVDKFTKESCLYVKGKVQEAKQAMNGVEIVPSELEVLNMAEAPTPIDTSGKIQSDLSVRLDHRYLDLRNKKSASIFKVRSKLMHYTVEFFEKNGFIGIQTPKMTGSGLESGADVFKLDYFGKPACLAQSPQLYKQMMMASGFDRVYEIGPVFRAERSHTTRHLTEFTGIDIEMSFVKSEKELMSMLSLWMKYLVKKMLKHKDVYAQFNINPMVPKKIPSLTVKEAKEILKTNYQKVLSEEEDLDADAETFLGEYALKENNSAFLFVTEYPWSKKPFYHMRSSKNPNVTRGFDLLWNGVEICTGSLREHRLPILLKQAEEKNVSTEMMKTYVEMFKYGCPPHGGAGFGLDRMTKQFLKIDNIREVILFPHDPERLSP